MIFLSFSLIIVSLVSLVSLTIAVPIEEHLINWSNITVIYDSRPILSVGSGYLSKRRLLGVLGPSGSGKSTFLSVISGRINSNNKLKTIKNDVTILKDNDIAYVYQADNFFSMITVEETLMMAARLRQLSQYDHINNKNTSISLLVDDVMNSLQLTKISHSLVGDQYNDRGISGGERKRLSVAEEMLGNPKLLICDEGTSGLDSFQALQVMKLLRDIAIVKNIAVVVSIHQPRSSIWTLFDDILLLTPSGKVAYLGPREDILPYFKDLGYDCPDRTNPAEFLIDLVSLDMQSSTATDISINNINKITKHYEDNSKHQLRSKPIVHKDINQLQQSKGIRSFSISIIGKAKRSIQRFSLLFVRSARQAFRDKATNIVRVLVSGVLAAVIGQLYGRQDDNFYQDSVSDRVNIIAQAAINVGMLSMIKALQLFKREKPIIDRERLSNQYSSIEYLSAKLCSEMPMDAAVAAAFGMILHLKSNLRQDRSKFVSVLALLGVVSSTLGLAIGALCPTGDVSLAVGPALMVVYVIMGSIGPAGSTKALPWFLKPLRIFSPFRWACEALCAAEFRNQHFLSKQRRRILPFNVINSNKVSGGDRTLEALGIKDSTYSHSMKNLQIMFGIHSLVSLIGLILQHPRK